MIRIHREGKLIVVLTSILLAAINIVVALFAENWLLIIFLILTFLLLTLVIRFFRVPFRKIFINDSFLLSPADGKIVAIENVYEKEYLNEDRIQISVFMSIHNVHINYYPAGGNIVYNIYHPGKYFLARHPKSSELNERNTIVIRHHSGEILLRQIAGYVARRIRCYAKLNSEVKQGAEMGFIRFGSRVDILIPADTKILVNLNDRVTGGITPLAEL